MNISILNQSGIDYQKGVARFLGDVEIYELVLTTFLADDTLQKAKSALERGDYDTVFAAAHDLKGVCGNADMTDLYRIASVLCDLLRKPGYDIEEVNFAFLQMENAYLRAKDGILRAKED